MNGTSRSEKLKPKYERVDPGVNTSLLAIHQANDDLVRNIVFETYSGASVWIWHMLYLLHMAKDWTHLFDKYRGKWVALADDETTVLAAADTAKEAYAAAIKRTTLPILHQVPETLDLFAGYAF